MHSLVATARAHRLEIIAKMVTCTWPCRGFTLVLPVCHAIVGGWALLGQNHTKRVASMIRKCVFACLVLFVAAQSVIAKEPKVLFNGKDLTGWEGDPRVWAVEDGAIVGHTKDVPLKNNTFLIWKGGDVKDFKLALEFQLDGGNSGIQYRSKVIDPANWIVGGYQADMDGKNQYTGILYEERGRGILAKRGERLTIDRDGKKETVQFGDAAELAKSVHKDDWNTYEIEAVGTTLKHTINGKLMS